MVVSNELKTTILDKLQKSEPLMDVETVRQTFLDWLAQIKLPAFPNADSWDDCLMVYPPSPEEQFLEEGIKIRLSLRLYTSQNQYLISIMECLEPSSRGIYIICTHVNWQKSEWQIQKAVEEKYAGELIDVLKAKHTVWAQTFRYQEFHQALNSCAVAMLGNEFRGEPCNNEPAGTRIEHPTLQTLDFPSNIED